ncbi:DUF1552 domain-containing protein [Luteolibacter algae]|uniref:DUF1552 domain-containing protein n=1 Tax=Luteolibacter algae TaxID=454151 RepID=A0ABW5DAS4_9BACT
MRRKTFSSTRRGFLRGAGVTMALPFLESISPMGRALAQSAKTGALGKNGEPIRFAAVFMANGVNLDEWTPKGSKLEELPRILKPLDPLKEYVNVISGINNGGNGHNSGTSGFLTGTDPYRTAQASEVNVYNPSLDQIIGEVLKESSVFPTLELGMGTPATGPTMNGNTNIYTSYISWKTPTTPVPYEINPQRAFDRLFKSATRTTSSGGKSGNTSLMPDSSVIDAVLEDAKSLEKKLGREDRSKLDEYFTAVREVEERIAQQNATVGLNITEDVLKDILRLKGDVREHMSDQKDGRYQVEPQIPQPEYGRLMMDIMALAFWSNSTRSATLAFGNGLHGGGNMSFIDGVNGSHHSTSHHGYKKDKLEEFTLINTFYMEQYAYLLDRLRGMKEGDSNVLENSMILFGSNISAGQQHSGRNIPVLLSGNAGGRLKSGRHIESDGQPIANLHRSILDMMDVKGDIAKGSDKLRGI